jgi:D-alanyl-D-alanine carboxypeptidase
MVLTGCSTCGKDPAGSAAPGDGGSAPPGVTVDPAGAPDDLSAGLPALRATFGLPGLAVAVFDSKRLLGQGADGVRKQGDATKVGVDDKWHLGSDTKAMTATLIGLFVERGQLSFSTTLAQAFAEDAATMDPAYRQVTLEMLLAHRGGAPGVVPPDIWTEMWKPGESRAQRLWAVREMLKRPPEVAPGTGFLYANAGYMMAGAALEVKTGVAPATAPDGVDQPWAHQVAGGQPVPVPPGPRSDNPPALGPAGTAHCSLRDWGKFLQAHLRGARGEAGLLSVETWKKLHTAPTGAEYALGWITVTRPWAGGAVLNHAGSNTMFYVTAWIAPLRDRALVVATNRGDQRAAAGADAALGPMIDKYLAP